MADGFWLLYTDNEFVSCSVPDLVCLITNLEVDLHLFGLSRLINIVLGKILYRRMGMYLARTASRNI